MEHELQRLLRRAIFFPTAEEAEPGSWRPAADIYRTSTGWLIKFDLAGVCPDEIELRVGERHLTIRGVRRDWSIAECRDSYSMEISYNRFERTLEFPCEVRQAEVATEYRDGMLLVRLHCEGSDS